MAERIALTPWSDEQHGTYLDYLKTAGDAVEAILDAHIWDPEGSACICRKNFNRNAQTYHVAREIVASDITVDAPPLLAPEWTRPALTAPTKEN
jgi:hypothetical protein